MGQVLCEHFNTIANNLDIMSYDNLKSNVVSLSHFKKAVSVTFSGFILSLLRTNLVDLVDKMHFTNAYVNEQCF